MCTDREEYMDLYVPITRDWTRNSVGLKAEYEIGKIIIWFPDTPIICYI